MNKLKSRWPPPLYSQTRCSMTPSLQQKLVAAILKLSLLQIQQGVDLHTNFCCCWFWHCTWHDLALSLSSWKALIVSASKPPANWQKKAGYLHQHYERKMTRILDCKRFKVSNYLVYAECKSNTLYYQLFFFGTSINCFKLRRYSLHVLHGQFHRRQLDLQHWEYNKLNS